jgi:hypothetical protein
MSASQTHRRSPRCAKPGLELLWGAAVWFFPGTGLVGNVGKRPNLRAIASAVYPPKPDYQVAVKRYFVDRPRMACTSSGRPAPRRGTRWLGRRKCRLHAARGKSACRSILSVLWYGRQWSLPRRARRQDCREADDSYRIGSESCHQKAYQVTTRRGLNRG